MVNDTLRKCTCMPFYCAVKQQNRGNVTITTAVELVLKSKCFKPQKFKLKFKPESGNLTYYGYIKYIADV